MSSAKRPVVTNSGAETGGMNGSRANKFRKGDRSRRLWTIREEEILIGSLLELVAGGWKSDNGFRSGYLGRIEDNIRKEFPKTDIKGTPHVVSKITAWKKSYGSLREILSRSGVGFNVDGEYKIDIEDDQCAQVVAADRKTRFMRNKSWPYWEAWKCIFGKDRACGGGAEDVDIATESSRCNENDYHPSFEDFIPDEVPIVAPGVETVNSSSAHTEQATNSRLDIISSRIGYEFDLGKARQDVFDKLGTVDGLTLDQRYDLCDILGDKPQRLEVFMGMPANARLGYVLRLIHQDR
ncbi:hypothetical protein AAHA92_02487 [Salvia divinorum]|uniref:Myb/SANT-like domain-containing protein n=1 Tax=Salvia divinorum TaxID=28513 RepID=A0ABD1IE35_SALDI